MRSTLALFSFGVSLSLVACGGIVAPAEKTEIVQTTGVTDIKGTSSYHVVYDFAQEKGNPNDTGAKSISIGWFDNTPLAIDGMLNFHTTPVCTTRDDSTVRGTLWHFECDVVLPRNQPAVFNVFVEWHGFDSPTDAIGNFLPLNEDDKGGALLVSHLNASMDGDPAELKTILAPTNQTPNGVWVAATPCPTWAPHVVAGVCSFTP